MRPWSPTQVIPSPLVKEGVRGQEGQEGPVRPWSPAASPAGPSLPFTKHHLRAARRRRAGQRYRGEGLGTGLLGMCVVGVQALGLQKPQPRPVSLLTLTLG